MNESIMNKIATDLNITLKQIESVLKLKSEGATIPFIARYRKEMTGSLDEEAIKKIFDEYAYQENLRTKKEDVKSELDPMLAEAELTRAREMKNSGPDGGSLNSSSRMIRRVLQVAPLLAALAVAAPEAAVVALAAVAAAASL